MLTDISAIRSYFQKLNLDKEIADIYLALHTHGPQSVSALSRNAGVERTRLYRLIDQLLTSHLIEVETHYKRNVIKAAPITNLNILINQKEQELSALKDELGLIQQVLARNTLSSPASRVQFYRGPEGIRQMLWNQLNTKTTILSYSLGILDEPTGNTFMHRWANEFENRGLTRHLIFNDSYIKSWQQRKPPGQRIRGMHYNYISPDSFKISHSSDIYDNVTAYYQWKDGELFGIEIYNQEIADTQRQFFAILWPKSKPETRI